MSSIHVISASLIVNNSIVWYMGYNIVKYCMGYNIVKFQKCRILDVLFLIKTWASIMDYENAYWKKELYYFVYKMLSFKGPTKIALFNIILVYFW